YARKGDIATRRRQLEDEIRSIKQLKAHHRDALVPVAYTAFFQSALAWAKENLVQQVYEESRALFHHTAVRRDDVLDRVSDMNTAALADIHARLLTDYDNFLKTAGRPYGPFIDIGITV